MPSSRIKLIEVVSGREIRSAPDNFVAETSADLSWRGITIERQTLSLMKMSEHFIQGHRLMINVGKPLLFEWKSGGE